MVDKFRKNSTKSNQKRLQPALQIRIQIFDMYTFRAGFQVYQISKLKNTDLNKNVIELVILFFFNKIEQSL
jgi:hypothetical protein